MKIKVVEQTERDTAIELIHSVFMEFEAPDYSKQGVETFMNTALYNNEFLDLLMMYGAYVDEKLVGIIATRNNGNHITFFFVDGKFHRQGIGRALFNVAMQNSTSDEITVNASPYAGEIYHKLGFVYTATEQVDNGGR